MMETYWCPQIVGRDSLAVVGPAGSALRLLGYKRVIRDSWSLIRVFKLSS